MTATLVIYDMHGRVVRQIESTCAQGYNKITLRAQDLRIPGVYYHRLNAGDRTAIKKLILTESGDRMRVDPLIFFRPEFSLLWPGFCKGLG